MTKSNKIDLSTAVEFTKAYAIAILFSLIMSLLALAVAVLT